MKEAASDHSDAAGRTQPLLPPARKPIYVLDSSHGLPSNQIHQLALDADARIWIASPAGAARYDGSHVDLIDRRQGFRCNGLRCIAVDSSGIVWVGTDLGLDRFDDYGRPVPGIEHGEWHYGLCECLQISAGEAWAGTASGLVKLEQQEDGLGLKVAFTANIGFVNDVLWLDESVVLAASATEGLIQSDGRSWWNFRCAALDGKRISRLARGPGGTLLVGTNVGLMMIDLEHGSLVSQIQVQHSNPLVTAIAVVGHRFWVAYGSKLRAYDLIEGVVVTSEHFALDSHINDLLPDNFGNLWIGTNNSGLATVSCLREAIRPVELGYSGGIYAINSRGPNSYCLGGENLLTQVCWPDAGAPTVIDAYRGLPETTVWDCVETDEGTWAATQEGLYLAAPGESFQRVHAEHPVLGAPCRVLMPRPDGLWAGSLRGLVRIRGDDVDVITGDGTSLGYIYSLQLDQTGALWIATLGRGLWREDGSVRQITGPGLSAEGNTYVACVGPDNSLLVIQDDGVLVLGPDQQPQHVINLPPVAGWCGVWLDASTVAIGASDGLRIIDIRGNRVIHHIRSMLRLRDWEFSNNRSLARRESGELLCGLNSGLVEVDLGKLDAFLTPPRCQLGSINWRGAEPTLRAKRYQLRPGRWTLTVHAFSAWFVELNALQFQFMLVGFDSGWTELDARPDITYTSLPTGRYRLLVRASSPLTGLGPETELLQIEVIRPWWAMGWTAVLASLEAMYVRLVRSRRQNQQELERNRDLEQAVAERTESLNQANHELQAVRDSYKALAEIDELTQLGNRRNFDRELLRAQALNHRLNTPLALLIADADYFKAVNDLLGHAVGDHYLRTLGKALRESIREGEDVAARIGGEEFAVLLINTDMAGAMATAERIRKHIAMLQLPNAATPSGYFTISIGIAIASPEQPIEPAELLAQADAALYRAKREGRDRVAVAGAEQGESRPNNVA